MGHDARPASRRAHCSSCLVALALTVFGSAAALAEDGAGDAPAERGYSEQAQLLIWPFKGNDVSMSTVRTVQNLVTVELSEYPHLSVISAADLERTLEIEAERQAMGCDDDSCMAEAAGALGAELVLIGELGQLGDLLFVNLTFLDTSVVKAEARTSIPVPVDQLDQLPGLLKPALQELVVKVLSHRGYVVPVAEPAAVPNRIPGLVVAGVGAAGLAAASVGVAMTWLVGYQRAAASLRAIEEAQRSGDVEAARLAHIDLQSAQATLVGGALISGSLAFGGLVALVGGATWATLEGAE